MIALVHSSDRPAVSREFLVRQSVLNALHTNFAWGLQKFGAGCLLSKISAAPYFGHFVHETVIEYRKLTGTYQVADSEQDDLELVGSGVFLL